MKIVADLVGHSRPIVTIGRWETLQALNTTLRGNNVHLAVVVDENRKPVNVITADDVLNFQAQQHPHTGVADLFVMHAIKGKPAMYTCHTNTTVEDASDIMERLNIRHLVVLDDEENLVNILSSRDVLKALREDERIRADMLTAYVQGKG